MNDRAFAVYLNDHLAGSSTALWTTARLAATHRDDAIGQFLSTFRHQLVDERNAIRSLLERLPAQESVVKRTIGVVGAALIWTRAALPLPGTPSMLEDLESLAIGVWGKRLLWGTLARVAAADDRFADIDVERLARLAEDQERELVRLRDEAIRITLEIDSSEIDSLDINSPELDSQG
jgi:hypothetical protein